MQFIITARDTPKDQQYLVLRLRLEQQRLFAWSETSGLLDYDAENNSRVLESNVFGLHRSTVLDLLVQIKVLFEGFEESQVRHKRLRTEDVPAVQHESKHRGIASIPASETPLETHNDPVPLSPKRRRYLKIALDSWGKASKSGMKRLRWTAFDKEDFESLLQHFSALNDSITGLLDTRLQKEIWSTTQDTNRAVLQLHHELADLQQIVKATYAMTALSLHSQASSNPPPYQAARSEKNNASGLETLAQLARFKAFNESIEADTPPDYTTASILKMLKLGDPGAEKTAMKISRSAIVFDSDAAAQAARCEATYRRPDGTSQRVWVEWKDYDCAPSSPPGPPPLIVDRAQKLAALLHHQPKPAHFRVPHCLGYFDNSERDADRPQTPSPDSDAEDSADDDCDFRIGFVFEKPPGTPPGTVPVSLLQLLQDRARPRPSVTDRVALARALANCILYLHSVNWLHKGLRSDNIIFFPCAAPAAASGTQDEQQPQDQQQPQDGQHPQVDYAKPYLSGFDFARPARPGEFTEQPADDVEAAMYRHPATLRAGAAREAYRKSFDVYALGVVLVELAHWRRIDGVVGKLDARARAASAGGDSVTEVFDLERARGHPRLVEGIRGTLLRGGSVREIGARMGGGV